MLVPLKPFCPSYCAQNLQVAWTGAGGLFSVLTEFTKGSFYSSKISISYVGRLPAHGRNLHGVQRNGTSSSDTRTQFCGDALL